MKKRLRHRRFSVSFTTFFSGAAVEGVVKKVFLKILQNSQEKMGLWKKYSKNQQFMIRVTIISTYSEKLK